METHRELFDMPHVYFVKDRKDVKWAGYSTVEAALSCIREVAASGIKYEFVNLISGQDYPIKPASYFINFLSQNIGKEFMIYKDFDSGWKERVEKYHFTELNFRGKHSLAKIINSVAPKRKFPLDIKLSGKETFWTFSLDCAVYVANYIDSHKKLAKFLKYTWGSDEFIFQTIILASPFKDKVVNNAYRYINWPPNGGDRPNFFVAADFERIMASDALFGRKFDIKVDEKILDLLDKANGVS